MTAFTDPNSDYAALYRDLEDQERKVMERYDRLKEEFGPTKAYLINQLIVQQITSLDLFKKLLEVQARMFAAQEPEPKKSFWKKLFRK